ncbi:MAG: hypothetical protein P8L31_08265 [Pseudomonadales bacterium]|nr:hypothetical protein [Pseudomonadales bacterium]
MFNARSVSQANSGNDHRNQPVVLASVMQQIRGDNRSITGLMIESHVQAGSQELNRQELRYGVSITDAGIGWEETEKKC